jgi:uncharacterized membrane protein
MIFVLDRDIMFDRFLILQFFQKFLLMEKIIKNVWGEILVDFNLQKIMNWDDDR